VIPASYGAIQFGTNDGIVRVLHDGREPQQFFLRPFLPLTNDEADAEPNTPCEEDGDDARLNGRYSRGTYHFCGLVDRRRAHRHESDPQSSEGLRAPRHETVQAPVGT
jgi:hypothetical protein